MYIYHIFHSVSYYHGHNGYRQHKTLKYRRERGGRRERRGGGREIDGKLLKVSIIMNLSNMYDYLYPSSNGSFRPGGDILVNSLTGEGFLLLFFSLK